MFCKHCGKEIADDSKFCNHCGGKQIGESSKKDSQLYNFIINHKRLSYSYIIWCLVNISLFLSSKGHRYDSWSRKDVDITGAFYPLNNSLNNVFKGGDYRFSLLDNVDVYDFSELFFYTLFLPIILWVIYKYGLRLYNKLNDKAKVNRISTSQLISRFVKKNIVCISVYAIWVIIHIGLYINALNKWDYLKYGFYPFDDSLEGVINEGYFSVSLVENVFVYDSSELWFYIVILPILLIALVKGVTFMIKRQKPTPQDVVSKQNEETSVEDKKIVESPINKDITDEITIEVKEVSNPERKSFPLFRRFIGSIIDKVLIVILFAFVGIGSNPYASSGELGTLIGLRNASPSDFEYIERATNFNLNGVDIDLPGAPYIGYYKDLEMKWFLIFIIVNVLYYIISESVSKSSFGKALMGGEMIDKSGQKASYWKIFARGILLGIFSLITVFLFRYHFDLSYYAVIFFFFLCMDLPLFIRKLSLLDICTRTMYVDTLKKEDFVGKYGKPVIESTKK